MDTDSEPETVIQPDTFHAIVAQNDMGQLGLFVDGKPVLVHGEQGSIVGDGHDRVGFYFHTRAKVRRVKVYVKRLAEGMDEE